MERRKRSPPTIERYGELPQHHTELSARVPGIEAEAHSKPPVQTAERRLRVDTDFTLYCRKTFTLLYLYGTWRITGDSTLQSIDSTTSQYRNLVSGSCSLRLRAPQRVCGYCHRLDRHVAVFFPEARTISGRDVRDKLPGALVASSFEAFLDHWRFSCERCRLLTEQQHDVLLWNREHGVSNAV